MDIPYNPLPATPPESNQIVGDQIASPEREVQRMMQRLADPDIGRMKKPRLVSAVCERVAKEVGAIAGKGWLPLTLGGDHSLVSLVRSAGTCAR